ncbi:hypothetical protein [Candidatus Marithrix sp. Canyon 246]|uniref:hypothetical protein n=1 Tax=Candidatus Marithrix sp. Canyon 246 TaxID=1827136 RepID=UPI00084A2CA7|nr:hypothetical protein [Candidatus Marithrix sp. Canyon 246]
MKLYKSIIILFFLLLISGCVSNSATKGTLVGAIYGVAKGDYKTAAKGAAIGGLLGGINDFMRPNPKQCPKKQAGSSVNQQNIILAAERKATRNGNKILYTGRRMTLIQKSIIPGSCWDYANEVYNRAGYSNRPSKRQTIFKGGKTGPYVSRNQIQPGDFLYYLNHSYGNIEHSAIFVDWLDYRNKTALMLSYGGESRQEPARYRPYDLSSVYRVIRAKN